MMTIIFGTLLGAFVFGWFRSFRAARICLYATLILSIGLFLFEIFSPHYGFRMPWLQGQLIHTLQVS